MRLTWTSILTVIITATSLQSCAEFIEYPLEDKSIRLLAPMDSLITQDTAINFWWTAHQDAKFYRLQIVSPQFDSIVTALLDTVVTTDKIQLSLPKSTTQKQYSWRVRPENNGSVGQYSSRVLTIKP